MLFKGAVGYSRKPSFCCPTINIQQFNQNRLANHNISVNPLHRFTGHLGPDPVFHVPMVTPLSVKSAKEVDMC